MLLLLLPHLLVKKRLMGEQVGHGRVKFGCGCHVAVPDAHWEGVTFCYGSAVATMISCVAGWPHR